MGEAGDGSTQKRETALGKTSGKMSYMTTWGKEVISRFMRDSVTKMNVKVICIFLRNFLHTPPFWSGLKVEMESGAGGVPDSLPSVESGAMASVVLIPVDETLSAPCAGCRLTYVWMRERGCWKFSRRTNLGVRLLNGLPFYPQRSGKKSLETWLICYLSLGLYIEVIEVIPILSASSSHPLPQIFQTPGSQALGLKPPHHQFLQQELP